MAALRPVEHEAVEADLADAERRGLRSAIIGRNVVLLALGAWIGIAGNPPGNVAGAALIGLFLAIGFGYLRLLRSGLERRWHRFAFIACDVGAIVVAALMVPVSFGGDVPQIFVFRGFGAGVLFIVIAAAALTLMPTLVLWSGIASTIGIWVVFYIITAGMERTVSWSDMPPAPTMDEFYAIILDPDFVGRGNRVTESLAFLGVAGLLAIAVGRARQVVRDRARAEATRRRALEIFGQYVPGEVAEALVERPERLAPQIRDASVLFCDVEGFTRFAETLPPDAVLGRLNRLFGDIASIIVAHGGVVIGFAGDALLAAFNVPLDCADHQGRALAAARAVATLETDGLRLRVGVASGPVAAGTIGSEARQAYTLYGDTVNLAQRLEALNKSYGTRLLADAQTWERAGSPAGYRLVAEAQVRNRNEPVRFVTADG